MAGFSLHSHRFVLDRSNKRASNVGTIRRRRPPVTVCIASLFTWHHTDGSTQFAVLTASDRMITAEDVEYEPNQLKIAFFTSHIFAMVAGDFPTHSDAIGRVRLEINRNPQLNVYGVAQAYGRVLCDIKREHAERSVLLPLSLTSETLLSRAHELPNWLVSDLTLQLQGYQGADVQALVVGSDQNSGYIYLVGADGRASCYNDVNFAAIGIGVGTLGPN